jgi:hypothetical protein
MAAHAVQNDEHRRVVGNRGRYPVLVVLTSAAQADLGVLSAQGVSEWLSSSRADRRSSG